MSGKHLRILARAAIVCACLIPLRRAHAQITCPIETCNNTGIPTVAITPDSRQWGDTSIEVTITFGDAMGLDESTWSVVIAVDGNPVLGSPFNYDTLTTASGGRVTSARSVGTVDLSLGGEPVTVTAQICNRNGGCADPVTKTYSYLPPPEVTGTASGVARTRLDPQLETFRVVNRSLVTGTYTLGAVCDGDVTACASATAKVTLAPWDTAVVGVNYRLSATASISSVGLTATDPVTTASGFASTSVIPTAPATPAGGVADRSDLTLQERSICVTAAIAPGAAYECGDLRLVHPLPATRVLNKTRAPMLIYNSQTSHPYAVVAAHVVRDLSRARPDSLLTRLTINSAIVNRKTVSFPGDTARVAVAYDASSLATGVYAYNLEVTAYYPGGTSDVLYSRNGRTSVVNRIDSPFGRGWWLAGLEQLVPVGEEEQLLVGGDGSTRIYRLITGSSTVWAGPVFDRPDTLRADTATGGFMRRLPGGEKVYYDAQGRHVRTVNTLDHTTWFDYTSGKLTQIRLPAGSLAYTFAYTGGSPLASTGMLAEVVAPSEDGTSGKARVVRLEMTANELTGIWDPQYRTDAPVGSALDMLKPHVQFTLQRNGLVDSRFDRTGVPTFFRYDNYGKLTSTATPLAVGDTVKLAFRAAETQGISGGGVAQADVYTTIDGPRTDVTDVTRFYLDRWGAPVKVVTADGAATELRRSNNLLPALVTSVKAPNGREMSTTYDVSGNAVSTTDWGTQLNGRYATSTFEYDLRWGQVTRNTGPDGQLRVAAYDTRGRITSAQTGTSSTRKVTFQYNAQSGNAPGMPSGMTLPAVGSQAAAAQTIGYDALGNVNSTVSAKGYQVLTTSDPIGRPVVVKTQIDTTGSTPAFQVDSAYYDINGRPIRSVKYGPTLNGRAAQRLVVRTYFDREGRTDSLSRTAPDDGTMALRTAWTYDAIGRRRVETSPDLTADTTFYDLAGNPIRQITRRGDTLRTRYDAMNRPLVVFHSATHYNAEYRGIPTSGGVTSGCESAESVLQYHSYPYYPTDGACGFTVPADSAMFSYDAQTGALLHADNADAKVTRTYYANGLLQTETQQIATGDRTSFTAHQYTLTYLYDLSGRLTQVLHPSQLAPPSGSTTTYTWDGETGALASVQDPMGNQFQYGYDARGQLATLTLPGLAQHRYSYDQDGRLSRYNLDLTQMGIRVDSTTYRYDARGKTVSSVNATAAQDVFSATYSGLGHLLSDTNGSTATQAAWTVVENRSTSYTGDALANVGSTTSTATSTNTNGGWMGGSNRSLSTKTSTSSFSGSTGRLLTTSQGGENESYDYDAAGNTIFQTSLKVPSLQRSDLASYYGSDGRLRAVDRRNASGVDDYKSVWEEYRYDALGRRVWTGTIYHCSPVSGEADPQCALNSVQRSVWDGTQLMYEIRMPVADAENDSTPTVLVTTGNHNSAQATGRALNTYGPGIDQPLSVIRMGYSGVSPFVTFPLWTPTGRAGVVLLPPGTQSACVSGTCFDAFWQFGSRSYGVTSNGFIVHHGNGDGIWLGSVLQDMRDASGLQYRRNRYYNPQTGRFTQEDPIGLAGGMNSYGFANGDPASYSDPFGLLVCFAGTTNQRRELELQTERATGTRLDVDEKSGCVTRVRGADSPFYRAFKDLVDSDTRYSIEFGSRTRFQPFMQTLFVNKDDVGTPIAVDFHGSCSYQWGATMRDISRGIAHELGHAFTYNHRGPERYRETPEKQRELLAMAWENSWATWYREPRRCKYADEW